MLIEKIKSFWLGKCRQKKYKKRIERFRKKSMKLNNKRMSNDKNSFTLSSQ